MKKELNANYWNNRYLKNDTPWDVGAITDPIRSYFDHLDDAKQVKILIPGCGTGHEAHFLYQQGFKNITICDWAEAPLAKFAETHPSFPRNQLICADFFTLDDKFDYIIEQTFFCAINPLLRVDYVNQVHRLLAEEGKLVGLMFNRDFEEGPPYGGSISEYDALFYKKFDIIRMQPCQNSITPRFGNELFVEMQKKI